MNNYDVKYETSILNQAWINFLNNEHLRKPTSRIVVEVSNTLAIDRNILLSLDPSIKIRIAGPYDKERLDACKDRTYTSGRVIREDFTNSVIYTRNEVYNILVEIEKIERGMDPSWNQYQKLIYFYNTLKRKVMYDPKYKSKRSEEIRSLRGLLAKQTVCAGYAVILKEFLDRNGITCKYVQGSTNKGEGGGHAWNIVSIDGREYGIDLTWDNGQYRNGDFAANNYLGQDVDKFNEEHTPSQWEPNGGYQSRLSTLNKEKILEFQAFLNIQTDYAKSQYIIDRPDGSKIKIAQIGYAGNGCFKYYYYTISPTGVYKGSPLVLYSEANLAQLMNLKRFNKEYSKEFDEAIDKILFSRENIMDSLSKGTAYIGNVEINQSSNKKEYAKSYKEIKKDSQMIRTFPYQSKALKRRDGEYICIEKVITSPIEIEGRQVYRYNIYESVNGIVTRNAVYSEQDLMHDARQSFVDVFLSRERLERKVREAGGYIGYYDRNGIKTYDPVLSDYFKDSNNVSKTIKKIKEVMEKKPVIKEEKKQSVIPTFEELKDLAQKYQLVTEMKDGKLNYSVIDVRTKRQISDSDLIKKATFASIWLTSSGIKVDYTNNDRGIGYAFNEPARRTYDYFCTHAYNSCRSNGVIDTLSMFRDIDDSYKYNKEIIANLFRTNYQAQLINDLFTRDLGIKTTHSPKALYTLEHAYSLAYSSESMSESPKLR